MLGVPLSVTLLVYNQSVGIVKKDAPEANLNLLEQSRNSLEKGLNQVNSKKLAALYAASAAGNLCDRVSLYAHVRDTDCIQEV